MNKSDIKAIVNLITKMFQYKILEIFERKHKIKMIFIFLFLFLVSVLELLSIGSILPIFTIIFDQQYVSKVNSFFETNISAKIIFKDHDNLIFFSLMTLFFLFTIKNLILLVFNWVQQKFSKDLIDHLSISLFKIFINQPYEYYFNAKSSNLVRNINAEPAGLIKNLFIPFCIMIMEGFILLGLIVFLILVYGSNVGIALFVILLIIIITLYFTRNIIKKWGGIRFAFETKRIKSITQSFDNIKDIIIKKKINFFFSEFKKNTKSVTEASMFGGFYKTLPKLLIEQLIIILFILYFFYYYNFQSLDDNFFSKLIFLGAILIRLIPGLIRISTSYQAIKFASTPAEKIYQFFSLNKKIEIDKNRKIEFNKLIEFKNLNYKFKGYNEKVLNSLNIKIEKNQIIGVVGKTGSGKTTFLDIFLGLLKPTDGKIFIDGKDFTFDLNQSGWHQKIGYVAQNVTLIDDSIKNNIALGTIESEIDKDQINKVIKGANLEEYIKELPDGIETMVGEKGIKLSGGQIQRIGIARAIYSNPEILCFDEATSSLDYETENEILKTILSVKKNKTVIIIAHRLKTIENCDQIIELESGKVKRVTTPEEILKNYVR